MVRRSARALLLSIGLLILLPAIVLAHPLGNFTVNHFAGIRVEPDRIVLDVVIDEAEIPTFQARLSIDTNGDGVISDAEAEVERLAACPRLVPDLDLTIAGRRLSLVEFGAGLSFPPGTAGLSTMRLVCEFTAGLPAPLAANTAIGFDDTSSPGRIGWHEVVVTGSGVSLVLGHLPTTSVSNRLRLYPPKLIPHPLAINNVTFQASPGGPVTPYVEPSDALPLVAPATAAPSSPPDASTSPISSGGGVQPSIGPDAAVGALGIAGGSDPGSGTGAVPGGVVGVDIAGLIGSSAITPLVLVTSLVAALMLGAGHALTPGHGKTLMGAYLVGSRGTALHAVALGLAVTVSHTLGIILLAAVILQVRDVAPGAVQYGRSDRVRADRPRDWRLAAAWPGTRLPESASAAGLPRTTTTRLTSGVRRLTRTRARTASTTSTATSTSPRPTLRSAGAACSCWAWPAG